MNVGNILQHFCKQSGNLLQTIYRFRDLFFAHKALGFRKLPVDKVHKYQLCAVSLCSGNGDLRACPGIQDLLALIRYRAGDNVHDRDRPCTAIACFTQSIEGIKRFTRLADDDNKGVFIHNGIVITEFACKFSFNGNMQGLLHKGFRNNAHMIRAAARNNAYIIDVPISL